MFMLKRTIVKMLLDELNANNLSYRKIAEGNLDEQKKRDAFMLHSGQVTIITALLAKIKGGNKK